jgi:hypothetical protein
VVKNLLTLVKDTFQALRKSRRQTIRKAAQNNRKENGRI